MPPEAPAPPETARELRDYARAAVLLHERLVRQDQQRIRDLSVSHTHAMDYLIGYQRQVQYLTKAVRHGRLDAAQRLARRMVPQLEALVRNASSVLSVTHGFIAQSRQKPMSAGQIVREIQQVASDFGAVRFDRSTRQLAAQTDPIMLEDVHLGRFEISLDIDRIGDGYHRCPYCIEALEPNPASSNEHVTHPHVSDNRLCEGDATVPIRAALEQGRIADFFLLIRSVLQTYNAGSPYVPLDGWFGEPCWECGRTANDDGCFHCDMCDHEFCEDCFGSCSACGEGTCINCLCSCEACDDHFCRDCLGRCASCGRRCCAGCLDEDDNCPECLQQENDDEEELEEENTEYRPAHAA